MTAPLRLVVFDMDGTLVDSRVVIQGAMRAAFSACGLPCPDRAQALSGVGLSVPDAMARLVPGISDDMRASLIAAYRAAEAAHRGQSMPALFPGARAALGRLAARDDIFLGVATGMSWRGLTAVLEAHDLTAFFSTLHCADHHPSKPHPSMIWAALEETGVVPENAVMLGDTGFDMEMARVARVVPVGVAWGYHPADELRTAGAVTVLEAFDGLDPVLQDIWGQR